MTDILKSDPILNMCNNTITNNVSYRRRSSQIAPMFGEMKLEITSTSETTTTVKTQIVPTTTTKPLPPTSPIIKRTATIDRTERSDKHRSWSFFPKSKSILKLGSNSENNIASGENHNSLNVVGKLPQRSKSAKYDKVKKLHDSSTSQCQRSKSKKRKVCITKRKFKLEYEVNIEEFEDLEQQEQEQQPTPTPLPTPTPTTPTSTSSQQLSQESQLNSRLTFRLGEEEKLLIKKKLEKQNKINSMAAIVSAENETITIGIGARKKNRHNSYINICVNHDITYSCYQLYRLLNFSPEFTKIFREYLNKFFNGQSNIDFFLKVNLLKMKGNLTAEDILGVVNESFTDNLSILSETKMVFNLKIVKVKQLLEKSEVQKHQINDTEQRFLNNIFDECMGQILLGLTYSFSSFLKKETNGELTTMNCIKDIKQNLLSKTSEQNEELTSRFYQILQNPLNFKQKLDLITITPSASNEMFSLLSRDLASENLAFYIAVNRFRKNFHSMKNRELVIKKLLKSFLDNRAKDEVNVSQRAKEDILQIASTKPSSNMFDECQNEIFRSLQLHLKEYETNAYETLVEKSIA
eukprot:Pgem_evm1s15209